jgi:hypothetical protein
MLLLYPVNDQYQMRSQIINRIIPSRPAPVDCNVKVKEHNLIASRVLTLMHAIFRSRKFGETAGADLRAHIFQSVSSRITSFIIKEKSTNT